MLKNYLVTALRNLARQKSTTILNVAGLALGITCSLVLFLLVRHMSGFDQYHSKLDRIYRVVSESQGSNGKFTTAGAPTLLPDAFRNDFPEAEEVIYISYRAGEMITIPQGDSQPKRYTEESGVGFTEPGFFRIFDRKVLIGDAEKGLDEPNEAVISKTLALKYFGREDAVGELLRVDTMDYKVSAIIEDAPSNTDLPLNLMLSYASIKASRLTAGWGSIWSDEQCYVLLKENHGADKVMARMPAFVTKYLGTDNYSKQTFLLQPLAEMHFSQDYSTLSYSTVSKETIATLAVVAIFLIVTACINFINLSTAEAIKRSKEVGIRKSLGSTRSQLVLQFLGEVTLVTTVAMLISLGTAQLVLNFINSFLETRLSLEFANDTGLWIFVVGITVMVSLLSGLYPSFVISAFKPAVALKNQISNKSSSGYNLRRGLVILQFVISQFFIIGTVVLISQMNYFQNKDLGFDKEAIILFPIPEPEVPGSTDSKMKSLRNEVSQFAGVESISLCSTAPSSGSVSGTGFTMEGEDASARKDTQVKQVDGEYIQLFDLKLIAGNGLGDSDTINGFVVNEQLTKIAGFKNPEEIVGKKLRLWDRTLPVMGVVQNFHTVSLENEIEPTVLMNRIRGYRTLSVKVKPGQYQAVIDQVKTKWEAAYPQHLFSYEFLDENIRQFYEGEQRMSSLFTIFTSIAIFIGCLGLFGLATFMANQKTKEIGVRKVLGASVESIVFLFSKEFIKLIAIAFIIACPLGWYIMNQWLDRFAYKITIGPEIFVAGFAVTFIIAVMTVGYRSIRAAVANPVNSLKEQ